MRTSKTWPPGRRGSTAAQPAAGQRPRPQAGLTFDEVAVRHSQAAMKAVQSAAVVLAVLAVADSIMRTLERRS